MGWVANWAWLALGLGGSHDPDEPASSLGPDALTGDASNGILPRGPAANLSVAGLGSTRHSIRPTIEPPVTDDRTSWDDSDDPDSVDPAILDKFYRKLGGDEVDGLVGDMGGDF
jgi:hypothetical protein